MKIKNEIIAKLYLAGGARITAISLGSDDAFQAIRFRREIKRAFEKLREEELALATECGLKPGKEEPLSGTKEEMSRFREMQHSLLEESSELEARAIPYEAWHKLKQENHILGDQEIEDALSNVFWMEPAKKKTKC